MPPKYALALLAGLTPLSASANIDIVFNYEYDYYNFFEQSARRQTLEDAALVFESRIQDSLTAIAPAGNNTFQVNFNKPYNPLGTEQPPSNHYQVAANEIIIYVGGASMQGGNLGMNTLGVGRPGGYVAYGSDAFRDSLDRGQRGVADATDFSLWGGSISFNKDRGDWYFDPSLGTDDDIGSRVDFYSVALHEIAHVLGIGTAASWHALVAGNTFNGSSPLTADAYHWQNGTTSTINGVGSFEAALDPSINPGQRKPLTDLDWNALRDIGWQVSAVPEPQTWAMLLAGIGLLAGIAGRRRRG